MDDSHLPIVSIWDLIHKNFLWFVIGSYAIAAVYPSRSRSVITYSR